MKRHFVNRGKTFVNHGKTFVNRAKTFVNLGKTFVNRGNTFVNRVISVDSFGTNVSPYLLHQISPPKIANLQTDLGCSSQDWETGVQLVNMCLVLMCEM